MEASRAMLLRFDPFREFEREFDRLTSASTRNSHMPLDAWRQGDRYFVNIDLPGVDPASIDLTVEKNVLTVNARRDWTRSEGDQVLVAERPHGHFSRQLFLGESLDADRIEASYENGVLMLGVPVAEAAKPRKVEITTGAREPEAIAAS
jgi:HSP20 family protein